MTFKKITYIVLTVISCFGAYMMPMSVARVSEAGTTVQGLKPVSALNMDVRPSFETADVIPITPQQFVQHEARKYGWDSGNEWVALQRLVSNESGWRVDAVNPDGGACGLFQALPCSKVRGDWTNPADSASFGLGYIKNRYGSPSKALSFWYAQSPHWY